MMTPAMMMTTGMKMTTVMIMMNGMKIGKKTWKIMIMMVHMPMIAAWPHRLKTRRRK